MARTAEDKRNKENLNPHKPAIVAMCLYGRRYAAQRGGSIDFWESLSDSEKNLCRDIVKKILEATNEG